MQAVSSASPKMKGREKRAKGEQGYLRRAIGYLGRYKTMTFIAYGALIIATLSQLIVPQLVQAMIDSITQGAVAQQVLSIPSEQGRMFALTQLNTTQDALQNTYNSAPSWILGAVALILLVAVIRGLFAFIQSYAAEWTAQGIAYSMRNDIFIRIQRLSFSYYDRNQTGQLMIRATDDVERVRLFIAQGLLLTFQAFLLLVVTLTILFLTNWRLTLSILPILPFSIILFGIFGKISQPLFRDVQIRLSKLNTVLQENVAGIRVVKAFVRQNHEQKRFDESNQDLYIHWLKIARAFSFLFPMIFFVGQIGQAVILYFSGTQIIDGSLAIGEYQKFNLYLAYVFFPLGQLGLIVSLMAQASASAERIFEIIDTKSEITDKPNAIDLPSIEGNVEFRDVTFRYFSSTAPVLNKVSFTIKTGQTIALLGATGSGKTTIINLIPRFYDASEGAVLIDGHDVRDVKLDSLRSQIGIVLQETNLFSGTIRDNIVFGRPDATDEEVIAAAKASAAHDFILDFPNGYETSVGERGATLSGGQKQRLAIARALLLNPKLLILDDSTSAVDFTTERKIQAALDNLMQGRTSFVIAQRISTARNADVIIVLDKGAMVAMGTHAELIENSPIYAEIFASQLVDDSQPVAEAQ
ncbi:MAG: ABC transporter ATP-binding protein [Phototrophicales bacterium]|nr:ABC transporter ATP-binding protein [Phototrophicales bacterium]